MYLLYVDASGTPENPGDLPLYVMVGVCVHEGTWFALDKRLSALKSQYAFGGGAAEFELHAKDFCLTIREQEEIPGFEQLDRASRRAAVLKLRDGKLAAVRGPQRDKLRAKHRQTDPFVHLTRAERSRLLEEALDVVGSHVGLRLFGEAADKRHLNIPNAVGPTFTQLASRFDSFLQRQNARPGPEPPQNGLLVMDQEPTYEQYIRDLFAQYRAQGHPWGPVRHVLETPFFVDSRYAGALQAADLCAYAVRRYIERADRGAMPEEQNFLRVFHQFDRAGGKLHGLRHYCAKGTCPCRVCRERGHYP